MIGCYERKVSTANNSVNGNIAVIFREPRYIALMEEDHRPYHHGRLRLALLAAAEKALEVGGVQSLSLRELSRELGVSHTSPRRHFSNKQALLDALAIRGFERLGEALGTAVNPPRQAFEARLRGLAHAYVRFALEHPALLSLMHDAKERPDAPDELIASSEEAYMHGPATFAEAQVQGGIAAGDPRRQALLLLSALQGIVAISTRGKFKGVPIEHLLDEMVGQLLSGFRAR